MYHFLFQVAVQLLEDASRVALQQSGVAWRFELEQEAGFVDHFHLYGGEVAQTNKIGGYTGRGNTRNET